MFGCRQLQLIVLLQFAHIINANSNVSTEFIILHNNDMHARFEQTSVNSHGCALQDAESDKCFGGFARVATEVRKHRNEAKNSGIPVFYLNAGDTYAGTAWFGLFKHQVVRDFLNKLQPDAISLGNHEFDEKISGLIPFLNEVNFPVLACNLDLSKEPTLADSKHLLNSTVLLANGIKIGVVGYVTPETKLLSFKTNVDFIEEINAINAETAKLQQLGVKIIIALGHSGYSKDREIAKQCPDADIVIGGHTNTFLYNGTAPSTERIDGPYPTWVTQKSGKRVPVVQAYAYTKYLGKLHVKFDAAGNLLEFNGAPILLDASVPQDEELLAMLDVYRANVTAFEKSVVGYSRVYLEGRRAICRARECNMGNLITDAMVFSRAMEDQGGDYWTDAPIALHQSGGIRSSINAGMITKNDIATVFPFDNDIYVTKISGKTLRNALEHSAATRGTDSDGAFLQLSGIHVAYNLSQPAGSRVVSAKVRCARCAEPGYSDLMDAELYKVIVPEFLLEGGVGHTMKELNPLFMRMQQTITGVIYQYLAHHQIIYPELEERILLLI